MNKQQVSLMIADVDNTLRGIREELFVNGENIHTISPGLKHAFMELHECGVRLAIASGRPLWQELMDHHTEWELPFQFDAIIGLNGGEVYGHSTGETKRYHPLTPQQIQKIVTGDGAIFRFANDLLPGL